MTEEEFNFLAKVIGVHEGEWAYIWFRAGIEFGEHEKAGGTKTVKEFIIEYLSTNYEVPKKISQ